MGSEGRRKGVELLGYGLSTRVFRTRTVSSKARNSCRICVCMK